MMPNITDYNSAQECGCILITNLSDLFCGDITHTRNLDGYRSIPLPQGDTLALRIFIDTSSVEVFINDGETVMSSRIYPQPEERELSLYASHGVAVLQHGALWQLG